MNRIRHVRGIYTIPLFRKFGFVAGFTDKTFPGIEIEKDITEVFSRMKLPFHTITFLNQLHHTRIIQAPYTKKNPSADGLYSRREGHIIVIKTADCIPLFAVDKEKETGALLHIGWKPAQRGIIRNFAQIIQQQGKKIGNFKFALGVGLRGKCFEIQKDFFKYKNFHGCIEKKRNRLFFNLAGFIERALIAEGAKKQDILDLDLCSGCETKKFFSFRREKNQSRTLSFLMKL